MYGRTREEKKIIAIVLLFSVTILGYLAGHGHAAAAPVENTGEASNALTTLNYASDSGWRLASGEPSIPGLSIAQPLVLAPDGDGARGGLIVGQLVAGESSPLPPQLVAHLRQLPNTQVVNLLNTEAYRYARLSVTGSRQKLTLYTIPGSASTTTAILCYVSAGFSSNMQACEQLAASLTIATGRPQVAVRNSDPLAPNATYGHSVGAVIARIQQSLLTLRREIRPGASRAVVAGLAARLAGQLTGAAESLSAVQPPTAAGPVDLALSEALSQARAGYSALGAAVSAGSAPGYATATAEIYSAEAALSTALGNLTLLGYA
jgi:hypothetical protein